MTYYVLRTVRQSCPCYQGEGGRTVRTVYESKKYATRRDALKEGGAGWRVLRIKQEN